MTENKGDLISRAALKKEFKKIYHIADTMEELANTMEDAIDNAPTVEAYPFEQVQELVKLNQQVAQEVENLKRPQGEWMVEKDVYCRCPFCNFKDVKYSNFCPDCGADMRPKPNHLRDCENCIHHSDNGCEVWECEFEKRSDV